MTKEEEGGRKARAVNGWMGDTDDEWFAFLARQTGIDEVGFWQAGGKTVFEALRPGETFLFELYGPQNYRASDTLFTQRSIMGVSLPWEGFREEGRVRKVGTLICSRNRTSFMGDFAPAAPSAKQERE